MTMMNNLKHATIFSLLLCLCFGACGNFISSDDEYCTVNFNANGGTVSPSTITVEKNGIISKLPVPTKTGVYRFFAGWYTSNGISGGNWGLSFTTQSSVRSDMTVYAKWSDKPVTKHTVTFNATGGTLSTTNIEVSSGEAVGVLPTPVKAGYVFEGWYTAQDGQGEVFTELSIVTASLIVYAKWREENEDSAYKYDPVRFIGYSYVDGEKRKATDYVWNTYVYTDKTNYSESMTQTNYDTSTNTISAVYQHSQNREGAHLSTESVGNGYNPDGSLFYDYSWKHTYAYFEDTVISTASVGCGSTTYHTGNNAGKTEESSSSSTYIVTKLGTVSGVITYNVVLDENIVNGVSYPLDSNSVYKYKEDGSYSIEYYTNGKLQNRIVYTNAFTDGNVSFQNQEHFDKDGNRTSYSLVTHTANGNELKVVLSSYDSSDTLTYETEHFYTKVR